MSRERDIERVYRDLALISRRARARNAAVEPSLSFVEHTLLAHVESAGGRAADLVELFGMDKSTISRQLAALAAAGYLERGARQGRAGQDLRVTESGRRVLRRATDAQLEVIAARVSGWCAEDLHALADLLDRFTEAG